MARIIHIEPTEAQWAAIDYIFEGLTPFIAAETDAHGEPTGTLFAQRIIGDQSVQEFRVQADGQYSYDELNDLHQGWTRYDVDGYVSVGGLGSDQEHAS
ncbi:MAG: hypothetical protein GX862_11100 [Leucobacter sp.]|nr:hypothetical protein [Leucobacter sp.]